MQKTPALSVGTKWSPSDPLCASDLFVPGGYADSSSRLSVTSIPRVISPVLSNNKITEYYSSNRSNAHRSMSKMRVHPCQSGASAMGTPSGNGGFSKAHQTATIS